MAPTAKITGTHVAETDDLKLVESSDETVSDSGSSSCICSSSSEEEGSLGSASGLKQKKKTRKSHASHPYQRSSRESSPDSVCSTSSFENGMNALQLNDKSKEALECKALMVVSELKSFISKILSVENFTNFDCYEDAKRLVNVSIVMTKSLQLGNFLAMFSHSVACQKADCTTSCRMLRRVRSHVVKADHSCALMHVYGQLLRLHVDTCHEINGRCGMRSCKGMREMRQAQGHQVLPRNFRFNERKIGNILKDKIFEGHNDIITEEISTPAEEISTPTEEISSLADKKPSLVDEKPALVDEKPALVDEVALDLSKSALIKAN